MVTRPHEHACMLRSSACFYPPPPTPLPVPRVGAPPPTHLPLLQLRQQGLRPQLSSLPSGTHPMFQLLLAVWQRHREGTGRGGEGNGGEGERRTSQLICKVGAKVVWVGWQVAAAVCGCCHFWRAGALRQLKQEARRSDKAGCSCCTQQHVRLRLGKALAPRSRLRGVADPGQCSSFQVGSSWHATSSSTHAFSSSNLVILAIRWRTPVVWAPGGPMPAPPWRYPAAATAACCPAGRRAWGVCVWWWWGGDGYAADEAKGAEAAVR